MAMLNLVISIVNALLMVIVLVGGIILMAMRRRDHGRGASLGISGCVVMLLGLIAQTVISFTIPSLISSLGRAAYEVVLPLSNAFAILTQVVGTALLVFGVIARRTPAPAAAGHPQAWPPGPGHHAQPGRPQQEWQAHQPGQQAPWQQGAQPQPAPQTPWQPEHGVQPGQGQPGWPQPGWAPQQPGGQPQQPGRQPPSQGHQPPPGQ